MFLTNGMLVAQGFDVAGLKTVGSPTMLAGAVAGAPVVGAAIQTGEFSATAEVLAYRATGGGLTIRRNWMPGN